MVMARMKKLKLIGIFLCIFLMGECLPPRAHALEVSAQYACLMDAATGRVFYEKNARERHSMASTTKIMTALVALESCSPDDIVTVSANAAGTEGSSIYLAAGEKLRMEDLLYGLMLHSGNDAAIAVAEHVSGSVEEFAARMTQKARDIGAKDTQFKNPNGLDADGHYTTAYDLALITRYALKNERFAQIVATRKKSIPWESKDWDRVLVNHNKLLTMYDGCVGVKTGFTKKTGRCLVSAAVRDGWEVIAVTLNAPNDWQDHTNMLNYAFDSYQPSPLVMREMVVKTIPVKNGAQDMLPLYPDGEFNVIMDNPAELANYKIDYQLPNELTAPVHAGQVVGSMRISYNGLTCKEINLISQTDIAYVEPPKPTFTDQLFKIFHSFFQAAS